MLDALREQLASDGGGAPCLSSALRVAVVGCGNISGAYGETMSAYPSVADRRRDGRRPRAERSVRRPLRRRRLPVARRRPRRPGRRRDRQPHLPGVHAEVTAAALEAGKHVHSEKPLARTTRAHARSSTSRTDRGLRLSCSPITFLGEAQETMWRLVDDGRDRPRPRRVRGGELEPDRELASATRALLPHRAVRRRRRLSADDPHGDVRPGAPRHRLRDGRLPRSHDDVGRAASRPGAPDFGVAVVELESGTVVRLTANFYVGAPHQAERDRAPRRHRLALPLELAGVRRHGRARAVRRLVRAGPGREPVPRHRLGTRARRAERGDRRPAGRTARPAPTPRTSSRSSTRSRRRPPRAAPST